MKVYNVQFTYKIKRLCCIKGRIKGEKRSGDVKSDKKKTWIIKASSEEIAQKNKITAFSIG